MSCLCHSLVVLVPVLPRLTAAVVVIVIVAIVIVAIVACCPGTVDVILVRNFCRLIEHI